MRTHPAVSLHAAMGMAILCLFTACGKTDVPPHGSASFCQIEKVEGTDYINSWTSNSTIEYNSAGNPVLRTRSDVATGNENERYRYDARNRLTDQITGYGRMEQGEDYWEWHRFKYQGNSDRPYMDSFYLVGIIGEHPIPRPGAPFLRMTVRFEYDAKGRIIKESSFDENGTQWNQATYEYNSQGNLERQITVYNEHGTIDTVYYPRYDNKINFLRTNKVWQFLTRDYSQNNTFPADSYNKYGLPLQFASANRGTRKFFLDVEYTDLKITYKCK
ncbi:hypothetical protein [Chitinophaga rhizophila]|uniref:YD repeat-containing protein n=1 Tax=Chitinophaga rhizophila TaxID=2866212 RepID=A0ABS7GCK8_9BACT|nr:hypothetical protein [Chitinophaga rhizophila]MBW8684253.1 hypothetical protein [Chitinophaga rhizophila]